ncbi:NAD(P)-binding Rossmann-fold containing protein [Glarea lozoyensis ATCC 20868]|uniref:NAD(P)-binding Rossmann-fold containing protein n=1 Tax=Glarea lozoyensis (strain ATCC 20868 / MF5171) TaxID=1116229 RepID=S3DQJ9_GLAL2|nr:NAD(P)-binding Rossmann-fold containing protein [Glarea lozoyensis ATCC 20868]EPE34281.1 NAD(P)-binding Rossmann-fold containing protein [Glarea lozoyensis ATCC 20868]
MTFIKNIAIVGGSGQMGTPLVKALVESKRFNLTAITRSESDSTFPPTVNVLRGDYDSEDFLQSSFSNQEVLIIILATTAPKDLQPRLIRAATAVAVSYILPTEFGPDTANSALAQAVPFLFPKKSLRDQIKASQSSSLIAVVNGLWFDFSLAGGFFGINIKERTARLYDDGQTLFSTTTLAQVARGVTKLFELPSSELEKFKNHFVYVSSFAVSQTQILRSVQKATGTSNEDWKISSVPVDEAIEMGLAEFQNGNFKGLLDVLYGNNSKPGMGGNFEHKLNNELLGLESEDLDIVVNKIVDCIENKM